MENQPSESKDEELSIPSELVLADPKFGQPGRIDLLLGAVVYSRLIRPGNIDLGTDKPTLHITAKPSEDQVPALEKCWRLDVCA